MADLLKTLEATGKEFDSSCELTTNDDGDGDNELIGDSDDENGTTIQQAKSRFVKCDQAFTGLYENMADKVWQSKKNDLVTLTGSHIPGSEMVDN